MTKHRIIRWAIVLAAMLVLGAADWFGQRYFREPPLPHGIASSNGRIEATEYDIATKLPGRVAKVHVEEGDLVEQGQELARMDIADLNADLREAQAQLRQARQEVSYTKLVVLQREQELALAEKTFARSQKLLESRAGTREDYDENTTRRLVAETALGAARVKVTESEAAVEAAVAKVARIEADIVDSVLVTPVIGRVLYRLAEPGEVLSDGGKVLTVLDLTDVYMTIFLPSLQAGRVRVGSEARIVLDALPEYVIPATISYVAPRSQYTPKEVQTRSEREKLMFRIKVRIDPKLLLRHLQDVKTGLLGIAYVLTEPDVPWPDSLQVRLPE